MNQKAVRARLEEEMKELLGRHERLSAHLRNEDRELPIDWPEMAQFMENDEVLEVLEERTRDRVNALAAALTRLEEGTYGTCATCGRPISQERLDVLDTTPVCASCA